MLYCKGKTGIDWHYDVCGEGPSLLFIHGWGVDKRIWRQQKKYFSQCYKTMTVDLPGHGKSGWEDITLDDMVEDLKGLLDQEGFHKVLIVGSSLGGLVALKLYEKFPQCVKSMVFVGSMPKFARSEDYPYGLDVDRMRVLGKQLQTNYPSIVNIFFRSLFTYEERQSRRYKWLQIFRQTNESPMKPALMKYLDILEKEDLRHVLKEAQVPLQFITGRGDEICNQGVVEIIKDLVSHARFDFFEGCGHFPFLSKPHEFNEVLGRFLKEVMTSCGDRHEHTK